MQEGQGSGPPQGGFLGFLLSAEDGGSSHPLLFEGLQIPSKGFPHLSSSSSFPVLKNKAGASFMENPYRFPWVSLTRPGRTSMSALSGSRTWVREMAVERRVDGAPESSSALPETVS